MKYSKFWQNPFADVFKAFQVLDFKDVEKKGAVSAAYEKEIGKKILKIEGKIPTASLVRIPGKFPNAASLGLTGNFVYVQLQVPTGSMFSFQITYLINGNNYRVTFSNLFKNIKIVSENTLHVPIKENLSKWTTLVIDSQNFLQNFIQVKQGLEFQIRAFELCSNMHVRNIFTSANLYSSENLPKEMQMLLQKAEKFSDKYQYIIVGDISNNNQLQPLFEKENISPTKPQKNIEKQYGKPYLKKILKSGAKTVLEEEGPRVEPQPFILAEKRPQQNDQQQQQQAPTTIKEYRIEPTPIMKLMHIQGFQGGAQNVAMLDETQLVYSSGNVIIIQDLVKRTQKFLFGQHSTINNLYCNGEKNLIVSTDQTQISFWSTDQLQRTGFYYTGYLQILSFDVFINSKASSDIYVAVAALDNLQRHALMVIKNDQVIVKQLAQFDVQRLKFIQEPDNQNNKQSQQDSLSAGFITIGRENITFWKVKGTFDQDHVLASTSVFLGEHARDTTFTDIVIVKTGPENILPKALVVSNKGNLYILDCVRKEMIGVYKIHDEGCRTIQISLPIQQQNEGENQPQRQLIQEFIATSDVEGRVKIWRPDFTDILLEVKLDSQVCSMAVVQQNYNNQIVCGCLNGTLGVLDRSKKLFSYIVRSHSDEIIMMKYHRGVRKIVTISKDYTIRIWEIMGSQETLFFQEVYEFRCLDEQVSALEVFARRQQAVCGFETGNLRVFDIKNYSIVCEVDSFHKARVTSIALSPEIDGLGVSADERGRVCLFNADLQLLKSFDLNTGYASTTVGFSLAADLFYVLQDPYNLKVFSSTGAQSVKFWVSVQAEKITGASFSGMPEDLFVITEKAKVKKYKMNLNTGDIKLFREYSALHNGQIYCLTPTANCNFLFTTGEDRLTKVWQYNFKGGLTSPAYQAYSCGEVLADVICSNDELNLVCSFGKQNRSLLCWKFLTETAIQPAKEGSSSYLINASQIEEQEEVEKLESMSAFSLAQIDSASQKNIFSNFSQQIKDGNYEEVVNKERGGGRIKDLYEDVKKITEPQLQQQQSQPEQGQKIQDQGQNEQQLQKKELDNQKSEQPGQSQVRPDQQQPQQQQQDKQISQAEGDQDIKQEKKPPTTSLANIQDIEENKGEVIERVPGQLTEKLFLIGFDCHANIPQSNFIWNKQENYYIQACNQCVIVNNLSESRQQKIFSESGRVSNITSAPNGKFFSFTVEDGRGTVKIVDSKSLKLIKEIQHQQPQQKGILVQQQSKGGEHQISQQQKIIYTEISPCSNYMITFVRINPKEPCPILNVIELASGKFLARSQLHDPTFVAAKWNSVTLGTLEFAVLTRDNIFFWRLNKRMSLEYIPVIVSDQGGSGSGNNSGNGKYQQQIKQVGTFLCLAYYSTNSSEAQQQQLLFVGTQQSCILIYDIRTGSLLCICKNIINGGPITKIAINGQKFVCFSNNVNVHYWNFSLVSSRDANFEDIVKVLEDKPEILSVDTVPVSIATTVNTNDLSNMMIATRAGVLWLLDFQEKVTLRLASSHASDRIINQVKYLESQNNIFSCGSDCTLKVWELQQNEQLSEFFTPKKECICFDICEFQQEEEVFIRVLAAGYSDGVVRFYGITEYENLGQFNIAQSIQEENNNLNQNNQLFSQIEAIKFIKGTKNMLVGNANGDVVIAYLEDTRRAQFRININKIIQNVGFAINDIQISFREMYDVWLVATKNGKIMVWNRKSLKRNITPQEELQRIYELEYYLTDNFKIQRIGQQQQQSQHPQGVSIGQAVITNPFSASKAVFSYVEKDIYIAINTKLTEIYIRNFREHLIVKTIPLKYFPMCICLNNKTNSILVGDQCGFITIFDSENGIDIDSIRVSYSAIQDMHLPYIAQKEQEKLESEALSQEKQNELEPEKQQEEEKEPQLLFVATENQISVFDLYA